MGWKTILLLVGLVAGLSAVLWFTSEKPPADDSAEVSALDGRSLRSCKFLRWQFADQAALPVPAVPVLIAAGALGATGDLDITGVIVVATAGTLLADSLWYVIGWKGGNRAIGWICRLSLEPDTCVTTTRNTFARLGPATLVVAKYIPGVQTLAPASAGFGRANFAGFLFLDTIGALLFLLPFIALILTFALPFVAASFALSEVSNSPGGLPFRWAIKAMLPIGFTLLLLATLARLSRVWAFLFSEADDKHAR